MSRPLGDRLRELRTTRGISQREMAELLGMRANDYQRIEAGHQHHHHRTLDRIDEMMIAAGFDWKLGLAAYLDHEAIPRDEILERINEIAALLGEMRTADDRLHRIERYMGAIYDRLVVLGYDQTMVEALRDVLTDEGESDGA